MKTFLLLALALIALPATAQHSEVSPRAPLSLQSQLGTTGSIGGQLGLGVEYAATDYVSAFISAGAMIDEVNGSGSYVPLDFSVGARVYPFRSWLYGELAYGFVDTDAAYDDATQTYGSISKERAFSYALGVRTPAWHGVFAGVSFGGAFGDENRSPYNDSPLSRFGMTLGFELGR